MLKNLSPKISGTKIQIKRLRQLLFSKPISFQRNSLPSCSLTHATRSLEAGSIASSSLPGAAVSSWMWSGEEASKLRRGGGGWAAWLTAHQPPSTARSPGAGERAAGPGTAGDCSLQIICSFHCHGFICQLATGAKSRLDVGNGPSCLYFSSVCFGASVLLTLLMQALSGGHVRLVRLQTPPQRTASGSWLHHMRAPA